MLKDRDRLLDVFERFDLGRSGGHEPFLIIKMATDLIRADPGMIKLQWKSLRTSYPDITLHHLEPILCHRPGNDRSSVRGFIKDALVKGEQDHLERAKMHRSTPFFAGIKMSDTTDYSPPGKK